MPLTIINGDIVSMRTDAIVNAANEQLTPGGGVCGQIYAAAGFDDMLKACSDIGHCDTGGAVITRGYNLPAEYVIHTVGPIWRGGEYGEEALLRACYANAIRLAAEHDLRSISFPLISSGIYGYPRQAAFAVATSEIGNSLMRLAPERDMDVYLVIYGSRQFTLDGGIFKDIFDYLGDNYIDERVKYMRTFADKREKRDTDDQYNLVTYNDLLSQSIDVSDAALMPCAAQGIFLDVEHMARGEETFQECVLRLIDKSQRGDVDVYKKANLDRKLFSKLRGDKNYQPSKKTALALALSLKLDMAATKDLLTRAGYALSPCSRMDMIIAYFIERGASDIHNINMVLFELGEECL